MAGPSFVKRRYLDTAKAIKLYDKGYCDQQIADVCDVAIDTVREWRRRTGLPGHKTPYKPKKKKNQKPTLVETAVEARKHGMTYGQYQVAKKEGWL